MRAQGRLTTPEEFGNIIVRESADGGIVRVKDVARVELGAQDYSSSRRTERTSPAAILAVYQLPGSNAVETAARRTEAHGQDEGELPDRRRLCHNAGHDGRRQGGHAGDRHNSAAIAFVLVILVVYIFLQDWRATLIPMLAVPVSLVGTFALFPLFGFSVNTLSLFGLVLAIGLVVDDAIVVVEGIQRHIEEGLSPKDAARKAMEELTGPVVGIALVLSAVFVPTVFIPGITGRLYQQFALTIAISGIISAFNALTLSPALGALLLRPKKETHGPLARFFGWFNRNVRPRHEFLSAGMPCADSQVCLGRGGTRCFWRRRGVLCGKVLPSSFLPDEDQGYMFIQMQLPERPPLSARQDAAREVEAVLKNTPGVKYTNTVMRLQSAQPVRTSYNAFFFVRLEPWEEPQDNGGAVSGNQGEVEPEAHHPSSRNSLRLLSAGDSGVGTSGGFQFVLEDRAGGRSEFLANNLNKFLEAARKRPEIGMVTTTYIPSVPQKFVDVDKEKVLKQGVELSDVYDDASDLHGRAVRQLLQPIRPRVAGVCRGGSALPRQPGQRRAVLRSQQQGPDGAAIRSDQIRVTLRAGIQDALQRVLRGADHRERRAGLQLGSGHRGAGTSLPQTDAAAKWASTTWACPDRSRRRARVSRRGRSSPCRCCSCSLSSLRCMKAGRCRSACC